MMTDMDRGHLDRALLLSHRSIGLSEPNPRVGCVIVGARGDIVGEGFTQEVGGPHAEVMALRAAARAGASVEGATAYVTLEPCAHYGKTPPCADALVGAGLRRVVVALTDPNPLVAGQGITRLREAGICVDVLPLEDPVALKAREINIGFLSRMVRGRPWVRVKMAASLDGRTALLGGQSQWITGAAARADGHAWRARATAVMTGMGTVRDDDPRLTVRNVSAGRQPWRVVLDPSWSLPLDAALIGDEVEDVMVFGEEHSFPERQESLRQRGVQVFALPHREDGARGLDLALVMSALARQGVNELHVEAGARLTGSLIEGGWVDELLVYLAPVLLGPGRPVAELPALTSLCQAPAFKWREVARVGEDLRLLARRPEADLF